MTRQDEELVGIQEIADRLHKRKQAIWGWADSTHLQFPKPVAILAQGRVWRWGDIRRWHEERERTVKSK